jgi:UDP-perosamine 4-acetyltransferase
MLNSRSIPVIGITDKEPEKMDKTISGIGVMGNDEVILNYPASTVQLVNGIGSTGSTANRRSLFEDFKKRGYAFATVIHPSAVISNDVKTAEGGQIMAGAVIQTGSSIGKNTIVNTRVSIDHDCSIGDHVHLAPGAILSGEVQVGDMAHIGTGAVVIQGVKVGAGSVVGAGAVVIENVPDNTTVVGIPAKPV